ncbi:MAG: hypothetical protein [Myoviridae sp. ctThM1]|nr:MAG: hypothetical protein [Myoviridae sp. ctThM1]
MTFEDLKKANPQWNNAELEAASVGWVVAKNSVKAWPVYNLIEDTYSVVLGTEFGSFTEAEEWIIRQGYGFFPYQ